MKLGRFSVNRYLLISIVILLAFVVRLFQLSVSVIQFSSDDSVYASMARYIVEGHPERAIHIHWRPMYPVAISFFYLLSHNWLISSYLVPLIFGSLLVVPFYLILC